MPETRNHWDVYVAFSGVKKYTVYAEDNNEAIQNGEEAFFTEIGGMKTLSLTVERVEAEEL